MAVSSDFMLKTLVGNGQKLEEVMEKILEKILP